MNVFREMIYYILIKIVWDYLEYSQVWKNMIDTGLFYHNAKYG